MDDRLATNFCNMVSIASNKVLTEQVCKCLGHKQLLNKKMIVRYDSTIGAEKTKEQLDAPRGSRPDLAKK